MSGTTQGIRCRANACFRVGRRRGRTTDTGALRPKPGRARSGDLTGLAALGHP